MWVTTLTADRSTLNRPPAIIHHHFELQAEIPRGDEKLWFQRHWNHHLGFLSFFQKEFTWRQNFNLNRPIHALRQLSFSDSNILHIGVNPTYEEIASKWRKTSSTLFLKYFFPCLQSRLWLRLPPPSWRHWRNEWMGPNDTFNVIL